MLLSTLENDSNEQLSIKKNTIFEIVPVSWVVIVSSGVLLVGVRRPQVDEYRTYNHLTMKLLPSAGKKDRNTKLNVTSECI